MLKVPEPNENQLSLYYNYIRNLIAMYDLLTQKLPNITDITKILTTNEEHYNKLAKDYTRSIALRMDYFITESIYTRQRKFFYYLKNNYYFDMPEERNEEINKILSTDLKLNSFKSNVLTHISLYYNSSEDKDNTELIQEYLCSMTRFLYFEQFFFWMKDFIGVYRKTMTVLLKDNYCLSIQWKMYIALMAVSTMKNEFLFRVLEEEFLRVGGDETWLIVGLDVVPSKLKHISVLNSLLAHQPWKIQAEEILKLKASMGNINELIEAALIMIQFHKLALIEENLRIKKSFTEKSLFEFNSSSNVIELSKETENDINNNSNSNKDNDKDNNKESNDNDKEHSKVIFEDEIDKETQADLIKLMEKIQKEEEDNNNNNQCKDNEIESNTEADTLKPNAFSKITIKQESFNSFDSDKDLNKDIMTTDNMFSKHTCSDNLILSFKGPQKEILCTYLNFNWYDNGIYTLQNLHQTGVACLDEEIKYITSLNSNSIGQINTLISTSPIRRAINYYIESLFGYYHEDYNYENITKLLDMKIKYTRYIKKITCYPKKLNNEDLRDMAKVFTKEEVVHIILIAALVKSRIQLVYLAKAINDVMKSLD